MVGFAMQDQVEPSSERGPAAPTTKLSPSRVGIIVVVVCPVFLTAIFIAAFVLLSSRPTVLVYKGKSLEAWFFGSRNDFFRERTRSAAREAIDGVGTNAFPFLLSVLKENRGNGALYFKFYRALPAQVQAKLPYPISGDDIKVFALNYIMQMRGLSRDEIQTLADCVPTFRNPRLRMMGFNLIMNYQTDPAFLKLCRRLINDVHPGVQLQAAIYLAQSAIASDPSEPRLFPILLAALESKQKRKTSSDLQSYAFQQLPPGSPGPSTRPIPPWFYRVTDPDEGLQNEIKRAMDRLERYLTEEQKKRYSRAEQSEKTVQN